MTTGTGAEREAGMTSGRYRVYGRRATGSAAVEAALALAGVAFDRVNVDRTDPQAMADYRRVNPLGQVPALVLPDGTIVTEGTAILLHVADAFPSAGLAPAPGSAARARHDRWLLCLQANVYEGELRKAYPGRYTTDPDGVAGVMAAAVSHVDRHYLLFEAGLDDTAFACGDRVSVLDVYVWMLAQWMEPGWLAAHCPKTLALAGRVAGLPPVAPVQARHFGPAV